MSQINVTCKQVAIPGYKGPTPTDFRGTYKAMAFSDRIPINGEITADGETVTGWVDGRATTTASGPAAHGTEADKQILRAVANRCEPPV